MLSVQHSSGSTQATQYVRHQLPPINYNWELHYTVSQERLPTRCNCWKDSNSNNYTQQFHHLGRITGTQTWGITGATDNKSRAQGCRSSEDRHLALDQNPCNTLIQRNCNCSCPCLAASNGYVSFTVFLWMTSDMGIATMPCKYHAPIAYSAATEVQHTCRQGARYICSLAQLLLISHTVTAWGRLVRFAASPARDLVTLLCFFINVLIFMANTWLQLTRDTSE